MLIAYLDCFAGIAGDMLMGALVDAGVPCTILQQAAAAMKLGATLHFETVDRSGIRATKVRVMADGREADDLSQGPKTQGLPQQARTEPLHREPQTQHHHGPTSHAAPELEDESDGGSYQPEQAGGRSLTIIRQIIHDSNLASEVKALAIQTFELLGASEAKIHNVPVDEVHFHEVGAVDAIIDIVASAAGVIHLNVGRWVCSPVNVGGGMVRCAHGVFPVPAPATADLLRGCPTYSAHIQKELVTPTGAALLRALKPAFGPQPSMAVQHIGYGAGTRNPADFPNVLRLSIGTSFEDTNLPFTVPASVQVSGPTTREDKAPETETVAVLETALDDATPQLMAHITEQAFRLGALDVVLTPVLMKKGRPGTMLMLLTNPEDQARFEAFLFRETTTLGIRVRADRRVCLERAFTTVETPFGSVRIKTGTLDGQSLNATPEFEDCRQAAEVHGVPLKLVQRAAVAAYENFLTREAQS